MSGTNFPTGVATKQGYDGSSTYLSAHAATTKFVQRTAVIRCDAQTAETTTGFTLPTTAIVQDVFLNIITIDATETVDVGTAGTSNDPNGFLAAASLATAGLVRGEVTVTTGANNTYVASSTKGALLATVVAGEDVAAGGDGAYFEQPCLTAGGDPVTYTCSAGSDTAIFDIIIVYWEVTS